MCHTRYCCVHLASLILRHIHHAPQCTALHLFCVMHVLRHTRCVSCLSFVWPVLPHIQHLSMSQMFCATPIFCHIQHASHQSLTHFSYVTPILRHPHLTSHSSFVTPISRHNWLFRDCCACDCVRALERAIVCVRLSLSV